MVDFSKLLAVARGEESESAHVDLETYSDVDLTKRGVYNYVASPVTGVWCMAWCLDSGPIKLWRPGDSLDSLAPLFLHIRRGKRMWAHNSTFERLMWKILVRDFNFPEVALDQWYCTMACGRLLAYPGNLDSMGAAMGCEHRKDTYGASVMKLLCKPYGQLEYCCVCGAGTSGRPLGEPGDPQCRGCAGTGKQYLFYTPKLKPDEHNRLGLYCIQDVESEREIESRQLDMLPFERRLWLLDQKINDRGVAVDRKAVAFALAIVQLETAAINQQIQKLTNGYVQTCGARERMTEWCASHGVTLETLRRTHIEEVLEQEANPDPESDAYWLDADLTGLPPVVAQVLQLKLEGVKPSLKKLSTLLNLVCADGRLRGFGQFSGAHTTRWTSFGVQLQNLPRGRLHLSPTLIVEILDMLVKVAPPVGLEILRAFGPPLQVLSDCLRGFFIASPGHKLIAPDHSQIEVRCLSFLAGDDNQMKVFSEGTDIYISEASRMLGVPIESITKKSTTYAKEGDRQVYGKTCSLAFQYGGGKGAGENMGKIQGVYATPEEWERRRDLYRATHPEIVKYWENIEACAIKAIRNPETAFVVSAANHPERQTVFKTVGSSLMVVFPSGGSIFFPYPKVEWLPTPWGKWKDTFTYMAWKNKVWKRVRTHGGKLAENFAQKLQRDCLGEGMLELDDAGYALVMHAHDEGTCENPEEGYSIEGACAIFSQLGEWAREMPVEATGWEGQRYRKE